MSLKVLLNEDELETKIHSFMKRKEYKLSRTTKMYPYDLTNSRYTGINRVLAL